MTNSKNRLFKSAFIVFYICVMVICIYSAVLAFPVAKIASLAFALVAFGMYGIAKSIDKHWDEWFKQKETS